MTEATSVPAVKPGRPQLALLWLLSLPVFIVVIVGISAGSGWVQGTDIQVLALALITGAVCVTPIILDVGRPSDRRHLLLGFFLCAHLVFFVLGVFTTYFFGDVVVRREEADLLDLKALRPADIVNGQLVVLVGLLSLLAGHAIPIGKLVPGGIPRPRREWTPQATVMVAMIAIPLGWAVYLSAQFGVLPKRVGNGFVGVFGNATYFGISLLMLSYLRHRSRPALALMALLIPPTMVFNYFTGAKGLFFAPAAVALIAYIVVTRRIRMRWFVVAFIAMSLFYPIGEFQRSVILHGNTRSAIYALRKPVEVISQTARFVGSQKFSDHIWKGIASTSIRFEGLGVASVIVRDCPSRVPYQGGWSLGYIPLSYVPRIVWPDKPSIETGIWVTENFGAGPGVKSHTGSTWVGEFWFNYGWPGVVLGMFVIGAFLRVLHDMLFQTDAVIVAQLMCVTVLFSVPPTLGGAVMAPINGVIFGAMPLVIAHWTVRLLSGTTRPATARDEGSANFAAEARAGI